jgi:hypothetical protein
MDNLTARSLCPPRLAVNPRRNARCEIAKLLAALFDMNAIKAWMEKP